MSGIYQLAIFDASPGTVLVVDDDAQVRGLLVALLRPRGYQVETASSAEEAQERLKTLRPDVLLLDLHLPGKSGQEVLAHLRADPLTRLLPIIMITGARRAKTGFAPSRKASRTSWRSRSRQRSFSRD
jgi:CheY-like chemotaxis protein